MAIITSNNSDLHLVEKICQIRCVFLATCFEAANHLGHIDCVVGLCHLFRGCAEFPLLDIHLILSWPRLLSCKEARVVLDLIGITLRRARGLDALFESAGVFGLFHLVILVKGCAST